MNPPRISRNKMLVVVLISGNGSNLQAIIDAIQRGLLPAEIRAVISSRADAYGLTRAKTAGIPTEVLPANNTLSREDYDRALQDKIDQHQPQLVILAGFMRILSNNFVNHYLGKLINIHPSLLPKYRGLNTHQQAIDANETIHGATVHFVTPELDSGPAIAQVKVPVLANDTAETLAQRVLQQEHYLYPLAIRWFAQSRLEYRNGQVYLDNQLLSQPVQFLAEPGTDTRA
ncbi:MAG TPA: phosphoribosylglycinamide formyltransferase [Gammaproteobacteria bacterium]